LTWVWLIFQLIMGSPTMRAAIFVSLANYILFFGKTHYDDVVSVIRRYNYERQIRK